MRPGKYNKRKIHTVQPLQANFRFERDMTSVARNWLAQQGLTTKAEFYTPWGVCDLVGISLEQDRVRQRLNLGQSKAVGPLLRVEILHRLPEDRFITLTGLARLYKNLLTPEELRVQLDHLMAGKFARVNERGAFQKLNGWVPLHQRIVALELKLTRVQDALRQAVSNLAFAEESFVGLPSGLAERVANSDCAGEFRNSGVGIVSVSADKCVVLLPSRPRTLADPVMQMHCVERFWRTRPKDN